MPVTHIGQYWSARRREVRLLAVRDLVPGGEAEAATFDAGDALALPGFRRSFRSAHAGARWEEVGWAYAGLPFPAVELVAAAEARGRSVRELLEGAADDPPADRRLSLAELARVPDPALDHLVAPIIPRRAHGFGVTYLNSALERETEGARGDYGYVYRAVKERDERPEIFLKGTSPEHFVGPGGVMGLRRDLTNREDLQGRAVCRETVLAGIEPELAAAVHSDGTIWGYTLANDVSGNRIENETLLYLAQAKHFTGCLVLGPLIWLSDEQENPRLDIRSRILDGAGRVLHEHRTNSSRINAPLGRLIEWACGHVQLSPGEVFSTGTDCVPAGEVKVLTPAHQVEISAPEIGTLRHGAAMIPERGSLNLDYSRLELEGA